MHLNTAKSIEMESIGNLVYGCCGRTVLGCRRGERPSGLAKFLIERRPNPFYRNGREIVCLFQPVIVPTRYGASGGIDQVYMLKPPRLVGTQFVMIRE